MGRCIACLLAAATVLASSYVLAQSRPVRVGILYIGHAEAWRSTEFVEKLRDLGYVEGRNLEYEVRTADGEAVRLPQLARELVATRPDVIVSATAPAARALVAATREIPIVLAVIGDPVGLGLTTSMSRPSANVTGFTASSPSLAAKRLQILHEVVPSARKIAQIWDPLNPGLTPLEQQTRNAAAALGVELVSLAVRSEAEIGPALVRLEREQAAALLVEADQLTMSHRQKIIDECLVRDLPAIHTYAVEARDGALISYGPAMAENYVGAALYVNRLLKGTNISELPFEEPTRFILAVNLRTARSIGLTIPLSVLARADELIE